LELFSQENGGLFVYKPQTTLANVKPKSNTESQSQASALDAGPDLSEQSRANIQKFFGSFFQKRTARLVQ
jgi:hypothetical protein